MKGINLNKKADEFKGQSDEELVQRYRNSHETMYVGELYERYTHLVFGVCLKYLRNEAQAEDVTMQVFEKLLSDLKKHHITAFKAWLFVVVKNQCMMQLRKDTGDRNKQNTWKQETGAVVEKAQADHLVEVESREKDKEFVMKYLKDGMEELKEEQRTCIELFYLKDCSYNEVAVITGYSLGEVKTYIQNGKRNLKNFINARNEQAQSDENSNS